MTFASTMLLAAPRQGGNSTTIFFVEMGLILAILYFVLFRPQRQEQQRHQEMLGALKKGDEIVTSGGIIGTVVHADEDRLTIRTAESTRLVIERGRIAKVLSQKEPKELKEAKEPKEAKE